MGNDHEHVLFMPEPQQCRTQEWADGQIYRAVKLVNDQLPPLLLTLCLRQSAQVDDCQRHERGRGDDLNWLAVNRAEGCAQNFVPAHNLCDGAFQRCNVEAPLEANRNRNVVGVVARVQLLEEPQSLLREGQGTFLIARNGQDGGRLKPHLIPHRLLYFVSEAANRGRFENFAQPKLHCEPVAHAREKLGDEQRMAAEIEKVVVYANLLDAEDVGPDCRQEFLYRCARRAITLIQLGSCLTGNRQRTSINLA